jgi:hypothetical protein
MADQFALGVSTAGLYGACLLAALPAQGAAAL